MKYINLRELYPDVYKTDTLVEVTEEVFAVIQASDRAEDAYKRRMYRYKAQYSLDCNNGIEKVVMVQPPTPEEILEDKQLREQLYAAVMALPDTVIVAPITSKPDVKAKLPTHCRLDLKNCLNEPSVVLLEQLRTLDKRRLKKYIGKLKKSSMNEVNRALAVSVGLSKFYLCQKECAEHLNQIAENNTRQ